jgi:hypothetical protein
VALDSVRNVGIIIDGVPWIKDIGMVSQNHFHFAFQNEDEFLPVMNRSLGSFNSGGFQSHDERFHMAVFLFKP